MAPATAPDRPWVVAPRFGLAAVRQRDLAVWVGVPLLIMLVTWHPAAFEPEAGLDHTWEAGLHMAAYHGIDFGHGVVFTYGPLGFLDNPTFWYSNTGALAFIYLLLMRTILAVAVFAAARQNWGSLVGVLVAVFVAGASYSAFEVVSFMIFAVWVVDRVCDERLVRALVALGGAFAGVQLLVKESNGVTLVMLAAITALAARGTRRINVAIALASGLVALLAGWAGTGQSLADLPAYVRNMGQIVLGYAAAMGIDETGLAWQYVAGWVAFGLGLAAALHMTADAGARRRIGIVVLWMAFCFFQFKEGFVRHDALHGGIYFVTLMGAFLAFRWRPGSRMIGLGLAAAMLALSCAANDTSFSTIVAPVANARTAFEQIGEAASAAKRHGIVAAGRALIRAERPLDPQTLALLHGQTTYVYPYETEIAWAYDLKWGPVPVFQSYSAYTAGLDQLDAEKLESAGAPQRILRNLDVGIDDRLQAWDEPATTRAILCHYRKLYATPTWQVLGRAATRCRPPVLLETVHAGWNQTVVVPTPRPGSFVFVRVDGVGVGGLERLWSLLYKPAERKVLVDGATHRLVEGTASDGLLLRAGPGVDYAPPFKLAPQAGTIQFSKVGQSAGGRALMLSFYVQSVTAGPDR